MIINITLRTLRSFRAMMLEKLGLHGQTRRQRPLVHAIAHISKANIGRIFEFAESYLVEETPSAFLGEGVS
jgi:hypothetical protein